MPKTKSINVGLIGAGRIGSFHGETIARRLVDAELVAIADPAPGAAGRLAETLDVGASYSDVAEFLWHPGLDAVIIATPARFHTNVLVQAAEAGKAIFCEKPMALTLEDADRAIAAARAAEVPLQVGFNRRWDQSFAEGRAAIDAGKIGAPQLIRSLTRDPGPFGADPDRIPPGTIFYETLIHDFDTLLWLNPGAKPVEVFAVADALIRPDAREKGFLDTAVVTIRFDNGSIAVAEANFSALYGYDIRGEVFGSAGMVTMGDVRRSSMTLFDGSGVSNNTWRRDTAHFIKGYTAQLAAFVQSVRNGKLTQGPTGDDARNALAIALASIESVSRKQPVAIV
ncbi:myo-inositol 2-dehydrogenase / D-chiro-inositol 1-dehydrogenase [Rhizobium aethiopicum]|uniref:Myo-inositol 2-dehydrogenase / D-chiro-inositol 1-dehydrogenase n=1 Tax=Rhizobium aethiopicum TaxID=1138170 RepID=A0A1C3XW36_9HYPH|nr:Gfo/Idh/MocA family oxidoreductase [Rhizobium aethiopicum]SCB56445.1 myo-inositol 2-dehydrogenase / D-chiro-inositol 1-dehydrogenase [Rhizobium aethiopicum]